MLFFSPFGKKKDKHLSVRLCDTLELVLLLDGVRVGRFLGGVDELVGEALSNRLNVSERCGSGTRGEQEDGLVHSTEWGDIDSLSSDGTGTADTRGVFSWTRVDHGRDEDLDWVFAGQEVDDLKGVFDDSKRQELLTVVSAVHHHGVDHTYRMKLSYHRKASINNVSCVYKIKSKSACGPCVSM